MAAPNFAGLPVTEVVAVTSAGVLNVSTGALVVAIQDGSNTQRVFNPVTEGNPVLSGDLASKWLPSIRQAILATVNDPVSGSNVPGAVSLTLAAAPANTVEASSPMIYKLSAGALVTIITPASQATAAF